MNYRKKNYRGKRSYSGRPHRRTADSFHQPLAPEQTRIPYTRHTLTKPDVEAVVEALLSGTLTQGRELDRFEALLAKLTHSEFAIAFSSGTAGIHSALACIKLEPEDEVIVPTLTFSAVANMVRMVGAKPVLVDCDPDTLTLSVEATRAAINENTKAVFTNNFAGHPSDLLGLREVCDEHNLLLLEDASHGLGGKYRSHYVGNQADLTCFSFHPSKAITTCEGGAVTTNNRSIADWLRQFRTHGIQKDNRLFTSVTDVPDYYQELQFSGMNYRLSEIHAALGRSQLTRLDRHIDRRRSIAQVYFQKFAGVSSIKLPYSADWAEHAYHLFPVQFVGPLEDKRDEIYNALKEEGIDVQVHYVPLHRMPTFANEWKGVSFPNADAYFQRCLSLPLFCDLSFKDLERVTETLLRIIHRLLGSVETEGVDGREAGEGDTGKDAAFFGDQANFEGYDDGDEDDEEEDDSDDADEDDDSEDDSDDDDEQEVPETPAYRGGYEAASTYRSEYEEVRDFREDFVDADEIDEASDSDDSDDAEEAEPSDDASSKRPGRTLVEASDSDASSDSEDDSNASEESQAVSKRPGRTKKAETEASDDGESVQAKPAARRRGPARKTAADKAGDPEKPKPVRRRAPKAKKTDGDEG